MWFFPKQTETRSATGETTLPAADSIRAPVSKTKHATRHQRPFVRNENNYQVGNNRRTGARDGRRGGEKQENWMF